MIKLTETQVELLMHRLDIPDNIAQAFTDTHPEDPPCEWSTESLVVAAHLVARQVRSAVIFEKTLAPIEREVLVEALEGSTWAVLVAEDPVKARVANRAMRDLAAKFHAAGLSVGELPLA